MIDVVIPYVHASWEELRYALRSMEENLQFDFRVTVVGDRPDWLRNAQHIPMARRNRGIDFARYYDTRTKMIEVIYRRGITRDFIWTYDDIVFLKPQGIEEIALPKAMLDMAERGEDYYRNKREAWYQTQWHSLVLLKERGLPLWNYETHTPRVYNKRKMAEVMETYTRAVPWNMATIYFNHHYKGRPVLLDVHHDGYKAGFYGMENEWSMHHECPLLVARCCDGKLWLNYNAPRQAIRQYLEVRFPKKSRFEA